MSDGDESIHAKEPLPAPSLTISHDGLPVHGYKPQTASNVDIVNRHKKHEEILLRLMDDYSKVATVDPRWLAIARTDMEKAFMALNRAIFRPERVKLSEDELYK